MSYSLLFSEKNRDPSENEFLFHLLQSSNFWSCSEWCWEFKRFVSNRPRVERLLVQLLAVSCTFKGKIGDSYRSGEKRLRRKINQSVENVQPLLSTSGVEKEKNKEPHKQSDGKRWVSTSPSPQLNRAKLSKYKDGDLKINGLTVALLKAMLTPEEAAFCFLGPPKDVPTTKWFCCVADCNSIHKFNGMNYRVLQILKILFGKSSSEEIEKLDEDFLEFQQSYFQLKDANPRLETPYVQEDVPDAYTPLLLIPVRVLPFHEKGILAQYLSTGTFDINKGLDNLFICPRHFYDDRSTVAGFGKGQLRNFSFQIFNTFLQHRPLRMNLKLEGVGQENENNKKKAIDQGKIAALLLSDWNPSVEDPSDGLEPYSVTSAENFIARRYPELQGLTRIRRTDGKIGYYKDGKEVLDVKSCGGFDGQRARGTAEETSTTELFQERFKPFFWNLKKLEVFQRNVTLEPVHPITFALLCCNRIMHCDYLRNGAMQLIHQGDFNAIKEAIDENVFKDYVFENGEIVKELILNFKSIPIPHFLKTKRSKIYKNKGSRKKRYPKFQVFKRIVGHSNRPTRIHKRKTMAHKAISLEAEGMQSPDQWSNGEFGKGATPKLVAANAAQLEVRKIGICQSLRTIPPFDTLLVQTHNPDPPINEEFPILRSFLIFFFLRFSFIFPKLKASYLLIQCLVNNFLIINFN